MMLSVKKILLKIIPSGIVEHYRRSKSPDCSKEKQQELRELARVQKIKRYQDGKADILGKEIVFTDSASFLFIYDELFNKEIYKFTADNKSPYIIDCGANIGLSIIYFKRLYPEARIVGFEPDAKVFNALKLNIASFQLPDVVLIERACWNSETELAFFNEGADGGRAASDTDNKNAVTKVKTIRLREYLKDPVDFLKIDIEGAEAIVLADCRDLLMNVKNIFVEYHSFINEEQKLAEILTLLKEAGFRLHINAPGLTSTNPFVLLNNHSNMDNQLNIYGIKNSVTLNLS